MNCTLELTPHWIADFHNLWTFDLSIKSSRFKIKTSYEQPFSLFLLFLTTNSHTLQLYFSRIHLVIEIYCDTTYLHFVLRFYIEMKINEKQFCLILKGIKNSLLILTWNQVFTCASVILRPLASWALSADAKYFCLWKRFSNSATWILVNEVLGFFRFGGVLFW